MAITRIGTAFTGFLSTASSPTVNYSRSLSAGNLVVVVAVNGDKTSTPTTSRVNGATDSAGNTYTATFLAGASSTRGCLAVLYCRLTNNVTTSTTITFTTTGTAKNNIISHAYSADGTLTYSTQNSGVGLTVDTSTNPDSWKTPSLSVATGKATGLLIGAYNIYTEWGTWTTEPSSSASPSIFNAFKTGSSTVPASALMAHAPVSSTGSKTVNVTTTASGAYYSSLILHFTEEPIILYAQNNVIEMF